MRCAGGELGGGVTAGAGELAVTTWAGDGQADGQAGDWQAVIVAEGHR